MENSTSFAAMARSWPLQNAQPCGAKLKPKQRISPIYGEAIVRSSIPRRENALQEDHESNAERRHQIGVRLAAAGVAACTRGHGMRNERRQRRRLLKRIECGSSRRDGHRGLAGQDGGVDRGGGS